MRIDARLTDGGPSFSFEFFPPRTEDGERNLSSALDELSGMDPTFVSVTYGAGGSLEQRAKTIDIVAGIKEGVGVTEKGAPFLLEFVVKEGRDFSRYNLPGL